MDLKNVVKIRFVRRGNTILHYGGGGGRTVGRVKYSGASAVSAEMLLMNKNIVRRRLYRDGEHYG